VESAQNELLLQAGDGVATAVTPPRQSLPPSATPRQGFSDDRPRIDVKVLGGFELRVNGGADVGMNLARRRSRSLLIFLALSKRHSLKRFELIECIWPDCDFESGRQRVYEATSFIRTKVARAARAKGLNPFVVSKGQGTIAFNPDLVTCDIDRFEETARNALAADDDARVVDLARKAMDIYRGDLCETPHDSLQLAEARRTELRDLYVDVAVAGAVSAMREDLYSLAVRMAWAGHMKSGLREDAVLVLMEALKGSGRIADARDVYHSYARRLLDETGEPPSSSLRTAAGRMLHTGRPRRRRAARG
jgi:DNA-binding SARP family transcriptional activator